MKPSQVLIIGSSPTTSKDIQDFLASSSIKSAVVASWAEASRLLRENRFDAVVVDLDDVPAAGPKVLAALQRKVPSTAVNPLQAQETRPLNLIPPLTRDPSP